MGKNPNPATQVLPRTGLNTNPKVKNVQEPELNQTLPSKELNRTRIQMSWFLFSSFIEWNCRYIHSFHSKWKKRSERRKQCAPKIFAPLQTPFPGSQDHQNLII